MRFAEHPFQTVSSSDADGLAMIQTQVAKKDPEAMCHLGLNEILSGSYGLQQDAQKAVKLLDCGQKRQSLVYWKPFSNLEMRIVMGWE